MPNESQKYVFVDIDGTLVDQNGNLNQALVERLKAYQNQGYQIALFTQRSMHVSIHRFHQARMAITPGKDTPESFRDTDKTQEVIQQLREQNVGIEGVSSTVAPTELERYQEVDRFTDALESFIRSNFPNYLNLEDNDHREAKFFLSQLDRLLPRLKEREREQAQGTDPANSPFKRVLRQFLDHLGEDLKQKFIDERETRAGKQEQLVELCERFEITNLNKVTIFEDSQDNLDEIDEWFDLLQRTQSQPSHEVTKEDFKGVGRNKEADREAKVGRFNTHSQDHAPQLVGLPVKYLVDTSPQSEEAQRRGTRYFTVQEAQRVAVSSYGIAQGSGRKGLAGYIETLQKEWGLKFFGSSWKQEKLRAAKDLQKELRTLSSAENNAQARDAFANLQEILERPVCNREGDRLTAIAYQVRSHLFETVPEQEQGNRPTPTEG